LIGGRWRPRSVGWATGLATSLVFWLIGPPPRRPTIGEIGGSWLAFWQHGAGTFDVARRPDDEAAHLVTLQGGGALVGRRQYDHDLAAARAGIGRLAGGPGRGGARGAGRGC